MSRKHAISNDQWFILIGRGCQRWYIYRPWRRTVCWCPDRVIAQCVFFLFEVECIFQTSQFANHRMHDRGLFTQCSSFYFGGWPYEEKFTESWIWLFWFAFWHFWRMGSRSAWISFKIPVEILKLSPIRIIVWHAILTKNSQSKYTLTPMVTVWDGTTWLFYHSFFLSYKP